MAAALITADDLVLAFEGSDEQIRRLAGQDALTGSYNAARVAYGIDVASDQAYGILLAGFETEANCAAVAAGDASVRNAIAMIWREVMADGKDDFRLPDGKCVFAASARTGRDVLRQKASGAQRTPAETASGASTLLRPRVAGSAIASRLTNSTGRPVGF